MAWTLTEPESGLTVALTPAAGDIEVTEDQQTTVLYAARGGSPFVTDGPRRAATVSVPELIVTVPVVLEQLRVLRGLGRRMLLTDDTGQVWPVKFVGPVKWRVIDTPDRATNPLLYVTVNFVGVA
jgi:hypothetical protein